MGYKIIGEKSAKKYKVYGIFSKGDLVYIGCTKRTLDERIKVHFQNSRYIGKKSIRDKFFIECESLSIEIVCKVLYSFDNKNSASACENLLINFSKKVIDIPLINTMANFKTSMLENPSKHPYCNNDNIKFSC